MYSLQIEGRAKTGSIINRRRLLFAVIVAIIIIADQFTKSIATTYLKDGAIIRPFGGDFVWLIYVLNPGFAFGVRILPPIILKIFAIIAASALGYFLFTRSAQSLWQNLPLTLIMGGAIGNLIDRLRIGEVIDFVSVNMPDFFMDRFPVFNVADSMVSIGVVILIIHSFITPESVDDKPSSTSESGSVENGVKMNESDSHNI